MMKEFIPYKKVIKNYDKIKKLFSQKEKKYLTTITPRDRDNKIVRTPYFEYIHIGNMPRIYTEIVEKDLVDWYKHLEDEQRLNNECSYYIGHYKSK